MTDDRLPHWTIAYAATVLFFAVGAITTIGIDWYATLALPAWMPPTLAIAAIWAFLFTTAAASALYAWDAGGRAVMPYYAANALLVLLWNYLFFGLHRLPEAAGAALVVGISIVALMARAARHASRAAWLLAPYLAWTALALYLNCLIWSLNP